MIIFFAAKDGESSIQSARTRPEADCGSDHVLLITKFRLKLKKVGSQETPWVTGKFSLGIQNEAGQRLIEFCQENALVITNTTLHMDITRWSTPKSD